MGLDMQFGPLSSFQLICQIPAGNVNVTLGDFNERPVQRASQEVIIDDRRSVQARADNEQEEGTY